MAQQNLPPLHSMQQEERWSHETSPVPCQKIFDLAYADLSASQQVDLYLPIEGEGPLPLLILIHGGAFKFGDKRSSPAQPNPIAFRALGRGYALAALNYRMSGEEPFPALVQDVKTAVRWLRAHAGPYHLDPTRFAAWGDSAGAYLATMLGVSYGIPELEGAELGNADYSSQVQAVIDWYGPTDFLLMDHQLAEAGLPSRPGGEHDAPASPESE